MSEEPLPAPEPFLPNTVYTVGHSNQSLDSFLKLLANARIDTLADVRSQPASRFLPQFDADALRDAATNAGIRYIFFGDTLGGRPPERAFYDEAGRVRYDLVAASERFAGGVEKLLRGVRRGLRVALLCSEENPLVCHRQLLVGRVLETQHGVAMQHLRADGVVQTTIEAHGPATQQSLFDGTGEKGVDKEWKSIPSVLHKRTPRGSLDG